MRTVCSVKFSFDDLAGAHFDAEPPVVSALLDDLLRRAPDFAQCRHHGVYNYNNTLGVFNTIRIQRDGLFVIMHDGKCFDTHPLIEYLTTTLADSFRDIQFDAY